MQLIAFKGLTSIEREGAFLGGLHSDFSGDVFLWVDVISASRKLFALLRLSMK